jgi:serine/threonine protein kinase
MRPELDDTLAAAPAPPASPAPPIVPAPPTAVASPAARAGMDGLDRTATAPRARADAATPGLTAGQQLGHFRIVRPLGAGGMGEVYLATDLALDRPVAIKVLPAAVARDVTSRERMVREARAQARITHPNVGHIYFIGEEAGRLYFAMEYVAGETLTTRIAAGPLAVDDALAIIRSAALGLREAQRNGITHRDVKPSNLMLDSHGMVKVLDFGLAAGAFAASGAASGSDTDGPVAQTSMAGTPLYMAPEQARGEPVDFRADIYALGATLFHLVSGRPPFEADDLGTLLSKHASATRPAVPRRAGQPRTTIAAVDALVARMMAPAPADRFASYDELLRALELASVEHQRPAGLWVRSMATLIDILITSMITAAVVLPLQLLIGGSSFNGDFGPFFFLLYALYATALIARNGRTPGAWMFELEVVDAGTGRKPALGRAAIRTLVPLALPLVSSLLDYVFPRQLDSFTEILMFVGCAAVPLSLIWASLRSLNKQTIWDRLSHTFVRYRTRRTHAI